MPPPAPDRFAEFYEAANGFPPFPWQTRLAARVCRGDWPRAIALPTAAGKTACLDVAVFALACGAPSAPRRVFFTVDRRIVVDQAHDHAKKLAKALADAPPDSGILRDVADALQAIAQDNRPLDVYALRGGMYRESAWARSPLQPTVIATTVDQVGSRLLFRGYGVSDSMKPVHAGLVGNDALVLLDEAHCAKPFEQTVRAVEHYRGWGDGPRPPFRFVSITATPAGEVPAAQIERDEDDDRNHAVLGPRIRASKPAKLVVADKAKGKKWLGPLVDELEKQARELAKEFACVGVIVNRVATARELKKKLGGDAVLLTGRMRPIDRDRVFNERLKPLLSNADGDPPKFVIGTQCLEVGADFDFHALVTECASLDALRQRFGRLNRVARRPSAKAVVVVRGDQTDADAEDPVYGTSLSATWRFLRGEPVRDEFDFGVQAVREAIRDLTPEQLAALNMATADAPVLFPAHLDCWVQTNPIPTPDPDPAPFLHGPKKPGQPDVKVVFRGDLGGDTAQWADVVVLCPPSSSEAVAVPIGVFKTWLAGDDGPDDSADIEEGEPATAGDDAGAGPRSALDWRGPDRSKVVTAANDLFPDAVYVVPCSADGAAALGDFPFGLTDGGEQAFQVSRDKAILRLLASTLSEDADDFDDRLTEEIRATGADGAPAWRATAAAALLNPRTREAEKHPLGGWVVTGRDRLRRGDPTYLDDSEPAESFRGRQVTLEEHSAGVAGYARRFAAGCGLDAGLYHTAGLWHDVGKLDPRFQAMLKASSPRTAVGTPLAKSGRASGTKHDRDEARKVHRYPSGARHELLSCAMLAGGSDDLLHLVATHHGSARPFADPVEENDAAGPFTSPPVFEQVFEVETSAQRIAEWNAELPERFWRQVRRHGWWGCAYREAVFRLADHAQSRAEQERTDAVEKPADVPPPPLAPAAEPRRLHPLPLPGLDGANPLAFLAALGTLRLATLAYGECVTLRWERRGSWVPVLRIPAEVAPAQFVVEILAQAAPNRPAVTFADDLKILHHDFRAFQCSARPQSHTDREFSDFLTAFADPEVVIEAGPNAGKTKPTAFYMIAGQQKLLDIFRNIATTTTPERVAACLFQPWRYDDATEKLSLRWDPQDDARYAVRWRNPSGDPNRKRAGSVLGANRLAFEALPLFPSTPLGGRLRTTGFAQLDKQTFLTWPVWESSFGLRTVRSLLATDCLAGKKVSRPDTAALGIADTFRSEKVANSDYSNLSTARSV